MLSNKMDRCYLLVDVQEIRIQPYFGVKQGDYFFSLFLKHPVVGPLLRFICRKKVFFVHFKHSLVGDHDYLTRFIRMVLPLMGCHLSFASRERIITHDAPIFFIANTKESSFWLLLLWATRLRLIY